MLFENVSQWIEKNKDDFKPPVCNKLMHKNELSIMFIGGPNIRTDFHLEEGSEFFYMLKGDMKLCTIQENNLVEVPIKQGEVFLLPSRIPHSPQRFSDTVGLVIERKRSPNELDGLRWYTDNTCTLVHWEKYFYCDDLGKDLVPVVKEYNSIKNSLNGSNPVKDPPFKQDVTTKIPPPFNLSNWIDDHSTELKAGKLLNLFDGHPDKEFNILVYGSGETHYHSELETWIYHIKGSLTLNNAHHLKEGDSIVLPIGNDYDISRSGDAIGLIITQNPISNKL